MNEPHGTIIDGRWKGTRGAMVKKFAAHESGTGMGWFLIRPFNDTAKTEDARIHLAPDRPILIPFHHWEED